MTTYHRAAWIAGMMLVVICAGAACSKPSGSKSAIATTAPAVTIEILDDPLAVLREPRPTLTLHGVRIGDVATAIPPALVATRDLDRIYLTDNNGYTVSEGKVTRFQLSNEKLLKNMKLTETSDVEFGLGKADSAIDGSHGREFSYLKRGILVVTESRSTGQVFRVELR